MYTKPRPGQRSLAGKRYISIYKPASGALASILAILLAFSPALAGKYSTSASWSDGVGDYSTGSFSISAGMSVPQIPSFSTTNITPTYYFPTDMKVNAAGFTTDAGAFINPTAVAFVDPPKIVDPTTDKRFPQGVAMVTFTNGLDGTMWQASDNTHIPAYVSDMDRQMMDIQPADPIKFMGDTVTTANVAYGEWKGNVNNITYQNIAFLNENLANSIDANDATVCAQQLAKNPQNIEPMAYNYTNLPGDKVAAIYLTTPDQSAHFSYSTGAYVMPGDLLVLGSETQYEKGLGADPATRGDIFKQADIPGGQDAGLLTINERGNISPVYATQIVPEENFIRHITEGTYVDKYDPCPEVDWGHIVQAKDTLDIIKPGKIEWTGLVDTYTPGMLAEAKGGHIIDIRVPDTRDAVELLSYVDSGSYRSMREVNKRSGRIRELPHEIDLVRHPAGNSADTLLASDFELRSEDPRVDMYALQKAIDQVNERILNGQICDVRNAGDYFRFVMGDLSSFSPGMSWVARFHENDQMNELKIWPAPDSLNSGAYYASNDPIDRFVSPYFEFDSRTSGISQEAVGDALVSVIDRDGYSIRNTHDLIRRLVSELEATNPSLKFDYDYTLSSDRRLSDLSIRAEEIKDPGEGIPDHQLTAAELKEKFMTPDFSLESSVPGINQYAVDIALQEIASEGRDIRRPSRLASALIDKLEENSSALFTANEVSNDEGKLVGLILTPDNIRQDNSDPRYQFISPDVSFRSSVPDITRETFDRTVSEAMIKYEGQYTNGGQLLDFVKTELESATTNGIGTMVSWCDRDNRVAGFSLGSSN